MIRQSNKENNMPIYDFFYKLLNKPKVKLPSNVYVGYSPVNFLYTLDPYELARILYKNGCNLALIEFMGPNEYHNENKISMVKDKAKNFIKAMRYYDITTFVNIVNWNSEGSISKPDAWFQDIAYFFKNEIGILQAASEWSGSKAQNWCNYLASTWDGLKSWNQGSRPESMPSKYNMIDYHVVSITHPLGPAGFSTLINTDHSTILSQIQNGGVKGQTANTALLIPFMNKVLQSNRSFHYYGFWHQKIDKNAINEMGDALKGNF
jgi:hypothetical protein